MGKLRAQLDRLLTEADDRSTREGPGNALHAVLANYRQRIDALEHFHFLPVLDGRRLVAAIAVSKLRTAELLRIFHTAESHPCGAIITGSHEEQLSVLIISVCFREVPD